MKPHITKGNISSGELFIDGWWCAADRRSYFGKTPSEAYERWLEERAMPNPWNLPGGIIIQDTYPRKPTLLQRWMRPFGRPA